MKIPSAKERVSPYSKDVSARSFTLCLLAAGLIIGTHAAGNDGNGSNIKIAQAAESREAGNYGKAISLAQEAVALARQSDSRLLFRKHCMNWARRNY
jgi:hypothetical protein